MSDAMKSSKELGRLVRMNGETAEYSCGHHIPIDEQGNGAVERICPECAHPGQRCVGCGKLYDANRPPTPEAPRFVHLHVENKPAVVCQSCADAALLHMVKAMKAGTGSR